MSKLSWYMVEVQKDKKSLRDTGAFFVEKIYKKAISQRIEKNLQIYYVSIKYIDLIKSVYYNSYEYSSSYLIILDTYFLYFLVQKGFIYKGGLCLTGLYKNSKNMYKS